MIRSLLPALLCLASAAAAQDGAYAPPERWSHTRGPASGGARSFARVPASFDGIAWKVKARDTFLAPPVTWDGVAFVLDGSAKSAAVLAIDTITGDVLARTKTKAPELLPVASNRSVFLVEERRRLVQCRLKGRTLQRRWTYDVGAGAYAPRIQSGEIYIVGAKGLMRLRAGVRKPVWSAPGPYRGVPAVYGDHVYALHNDGGALKVVVHARGDGAVVHECSVSRSASTERGGEVLVTNGLVAVRMAPHTSREWALLTTQTTRDAPELTFARMVKLRSQPMGGRGFLIALTDKSTWAVLRVPKKGGKKKAGPPVMPLVGKGSRSDLVVGATSPVFLGGGAVCFGTWAADVNANLIFWHLDEHKDIRDFAKGVRYAAVPAGHERLLVVARDGKALYAVGPGEFEK